MPAMIINLGASFAEQFLQLCPKRGILRWLSFGHTLEPPAGIMNMLGLVALQKKGVDIVGCVLHAVLIEHYGVSRKAHGGEAVVLRDHNIAGLNSD